MNQQQQSGPSLIGSYNFVQWAVQFPALTLMVFLRKNLGIRILHPVKLVIVMGLLAVVAILVTPGNEASRPGDLLLFAIVAFLFGIAQRIRRSVDLYRGLHQHSYYIGDSIWDFAWLPNIVRRHRRVSRFFDPTLSVAVGLALFPHSRALAIYLIFAGWSLASHELQVFQREWHRDRDLIDSVLIAEEQNRTLEQFEQAQQAPQDQPGQGIPTGLGDDIRENIEKQKQNRKRP